MNRLISFILTISLVTSSVFFAYGNNEVLAEQSTNQEGLSGTELEQEQIDELTVPVESGIGDDGYNGYIVKVAKKKTGEIDEDAVEDYDSTSNNMYVRVDNPEDALDFIDPEYVEYIEPNYVRHSFGKVKAITKGALTTANKEAYRLIKAFDAWGNGFSGAGESVAIFDTGITNNKHNGFSETKFGELYNFVGSYYNPSVINSSVADGYKAGHGTPVTSLVAANGGVTVQGIAYASEVSMGRIMNNNGDGSTFDFIKALSYFNGSKSDGSLPDVINMSFGGEGYNRSEYLAIKELTDKGTIAIAAAGNDGQTGSVYNYPANYENVIGVGSVNTNKTVSNFSTQNSSVLVSAPGNGVVGISNRSNMYVYCQGTSFSSPIIAGTAALASEFIGTTNQTDKKYNQNRFLTLIKQTSQDVNTSGYDIHTGYGIVDVNKLALSASALGLNIPRSYQIAYETDGGVFAGSPPTIHTTDTTTNLISNLTKKGYNFSHWVNENGAKVTSIPYNYAPSSGDDGNMTLIAVWTPKSYKLKFYGNGGKVKKKSRTVKYYTAIGSLKTPKKRNGYNFLGWFTKKKGGSQYYKGMTYKTAGDKKLYAHWTKKKVVKFNANGGIVKKYAKKITKGKTYGTLPNPKRTGYTFKGWYTKKKGGTKITKKTRVARNKNYTIYAKWKKS